MPGKRPATPDEIEELKAVGIPVGPDGIVRLEEAAKDVGFNVEEHDAWLREWVAAKVVPAFLWANRLTLGAPGVLAGLDEFDIWSHLITPADRVVTSQVLMTLLGATTVQVGAIALAIGRYLFPSRSGGGSQE